jgi:uncharacterized protein (TIGR03435 family)
MKLGIAAKIGLIIFGMVGILVYVACGQAGINAEGTPAAVPQFEVSSVRLNQTGTRAFRSINTPNGVVISNAPLILVIRQAYGLFNSNDDRISGVPSWTKSERYDIAAKVNAADATALSKLTRDQRGLMLQELLADRFKLKVHREMKVLPIFALVVAKRGPLLKPAQGGGDTVNFGEGHIQAQGIPLSSLASMLTQETGRTVVDETGLTGKYDLTLDWAPDDGDSSDAGGEQRDSSGPSIFTAVEEKLGLRLVSEKGPVEGLVIDHVERPSEN